jgi:hypothetical protein
MFVEQKPKATRGDSSMLAICVPNVFHLPRPRAMDVTAVYILFFWSMYVAAERTNPGLWTKIETLADLDKEVVKPFWDLHENKEDPMIKFRYIICRLMESFQDKRLVKKQLSMIAVSGHPLPNNWVYPKQLHAKLRLPPCAGRPISTGYAREEARSVAVVKMLDDNANAEESDKVKKERNKCRNILFCLLWFAPESPKKSQTIQ